MLLREQKFTVSSYVQDLADTNVSGLPSCVLDFSVPLGRTPLVAHDGSSPYSADVDLVLRHPILELDFEHKKTVKKVLGTITMGYFLHTVAELAETKSCYFTRTGNLAAKTPAHYKSPSMMYINKSRIFLRSADVKGPVHSAMRSRTRVEAL
jgi:hypothetical protein